MLKPFRTTYVAAFLTAAALPGYAADPKPTVVLVHGAFADASSWGGVITRLEDEGFRVIAVANPLRGVKSDADYVRRVVAGINGPVVLVGHSYGGSVINDAVPKEGNVKALVFVAAFAPEEGRARPSFLENSPEAHWQVPLATPSNSKVVRKTSTLSRTSFTISSQQMSPRTRRGLWRQRSAR